MASYGQSPRRPKPLLLLFGLLLLSLAFGAGAALLLLAQLTAALFVGFGLACGDRIDTCADRFDRQGDDLRRRADQTTAQQGQQHHDQENTLHYAAPHAPSDE